MKSSDLSPYTGITDFTCFEQVQEMLSVFNTFRPPGSNRKLHVGVMTSYKVMSGLPTKWAAVFPPIQKIGEIFSSAETYNCLHYADYDGSPDSYSQISEAVAFGGNTIHAVQLDMIWPDPGHLKKALLETKPLEVILQIGSNALEATNNDPTSVVKRFTSYADIVDRVLLDKSMGKGVPMDADTLLPFVRALKETFPGLGIGVAGGLGPETIHLVEPIAKEFPEVSIDAQSRLRPSGSALDPINWTMATGYLAGASLILR